jgi:hypothetical protein
MNCSETRKELVGYLMGDLAGPARDAVEAHLRGCAECRAERRTAAAGLEAMRRYPEADTSPLRVERALARIRQAAAAQRPRRAVGAGRIALWGAAPVAALVLSAAVLRPGRPPAYPPLAFRLAEAYGTVEIQRTGNTRWEPLSAGAEVSEGNRVRTRFPGRACLVSRDRCEVVLDADTYLQINRPGDAGTDDSLTFFYGRALVRCAGTGPRRLVVDTPTGQQLLARGAAYEISDR